MKSDPASLDNLRDIAEPPPVPWYPFAPGWWVLIGLAVVAAGYFGIRAWFAWKRNAYRRAALDELNAVEDLTRASEILKRTALVAYPRNQVAALTGAAWCQWLEETGSVPMSDRVREVLTKGIYGDPELDCPNEVMEFSRAWISGHRPYRVEGGPEC